MRAWVRTNCGSWDAVWQTILFEHFGPKLNESRRDIAWGLYAILLVGFYGALSTASEITQLRPDSSTLAISLASYLSDDRVTLDAVSLWTTKGLRWIPFVALLLDTVVVCLGVVLLLFYRWRAMSVWKGSSSRSSQFLKIGGVAAIGLWGLVDAIENLTGLAILLWPPSSPTGLVTVMTSASAAKWWAFLLTVGFLLPLPVMWFWGLGRFHSLSVDGSEGEDRQRQRLRVGLYEVFWRSRYTVLGLIVYGLAMLAFDQTRDVITFLADSVSLDPHSGNVLWGREWWGGVGLMLGSLVSVMMLSHVSWLWPRVMCRIHAPRFESGIRQKDAGNQNTASETLSGHRSSDPSWPEDVERLAEWWPRFLGLTPYMIVIYLCALAARDAVRVNALDLVVTLLFMMAGLAVVGGAWVFWHQQNGKKQQKKKDHRRYFQTGTTFGSLITELHHPPYQLWGIPGASIFMPMVALLLAAGVRVLPLVTSTVPFPTFPVLTCLFAVWFSVIGVLAAKSQEHALPYLPSLIVLSAIFSASGWTDKHKLWVWMEQSGTAMDQLATQGLMTMWKLQFVLASGLVLAMLLIWSIYRYDVGKQLTVKWRLVGVLFMVIGLFWGVLAVANRTLPRSLVGRTTPQPVVVSETCQPAEEPYRCELRGAIVEWIQELPEFKAAQEVKTDQLLQDDRFSAPIPVYFVSSQGGGIRAGYWTALVLARLSETLPEFDQRTFSVSGVSGGSIGASVYRVCQQQKQDSVETCVRKFGEHDFLTSLLAGWLFEDALGRFVPTSLCATPGCGLLNRDAWFEQTLEAAQPGLHDRVRAPRTPTTRAHRPYLLLNAVWVETGERVIASDLVIDPKWFPGAHDLLGMVGDGVSLSTASATSARFPFTNAIGSLHGDPTTCHLNPLPVVPSGDRPVCGHLADGGYYDNSGGFTTTDVIRAVDRVIVEEEARACGAHDSSGCHAWRWMKRSLRPRVIEIRTGVNPALNASDRCPKEKDPAKPQCGIPDSVFVDGLGPALTVMRTREANQWYGMTMERWEARRFWPTVAAGSELPWVYSIDLPDNGVRFPLGWGLSHRAQRAMIEVSERPTLYEPLLSSLHLPSADSSALLQ